MAAPTFIASYHTDFQYMGQSNGVNVTTQAGDLLVVYAATDPGGAFNAPTGNSVTFTGRGVSSPVGGYSVVQFWSGVDATGGTNWSLSITLAAGTTWGMSVYVFRNSKGIGNTAYGNGDNTTQTVGLATQAANSAIVVLQTDEDTLNGTGSRTWATVNSITPTAGNGYERDLTYLPGTWSVYGGYYYDAGTAGTKNVGVTAPANQKFNIGSIEVIGSFLPLLTTQSVTGKTGTTATLNGNVTSAEGAAITERGFCWSTTTNPTTASNKVTAAGTTGYYNAGISGLSPATIYYVRAYAINSNGTAYGNEVTFQYTGASIQIDASTPLPLESPYPATTKSTTSFTPPAGSLLVALVGGATDINDTDAISVSGGSLTWTRRVLKSFRTTSTGGASTFQGTAEIWTAFAATSPGSIAVTFTPTAEMYAYIASVQVLTGSEGARLTGQFGATTGSGDDNFPQDIWLGGISSGSLVFAVSSDSDEMGLATFAPGQNEIINSGYAHIWRTSDPTSAGAVQMYMNGPTYQSSNISAIEIKAALGGGGRTAWLK